jgi:hypothetical protein
MAAVEDGATQAKALRARLASKVTSKIRSSPHSDEGLPSALGSLLSDGLKSLDLSDVGLGDDECALGKRVLVDFIRSRRLGALRHLAIDGNSLSKVREFRNIVLMSLNSRFFIRSMLHRSEKPYHRLFHLYSNQNLKVTL